MGSVLAVTESADDPTNQELDADIDMDLLAYVQTLPPEQRIAGMKLRSNWSAR